jgi:hypothetical protein
MNHNKIFIRKIFIIKISDVPADTQHKQYEKSYMALNSKNFFTKANKNKFKEKLVISEKF